MCLRPQALALNRAELRSTEVEILIKSADHILEVTYYYRYRQINTLDQLDDAIDLIEQAEGFIYQAGYLIKGQPQDVIERYERVRLGIKSRTDMLEARISEMLNRSETRRMA